MFESMTQDEWLEPSKEALADMTRTLARASLERPMVPQELIPRLRKNRDGWAWSTDSAINSWAVYSMFGEAAISPLERCLASEQSNFWMFGHRGYGANSYGIGLVARVGPLFVAHQHGWGGAYMSEKAGRSVDAATQSWNETLRTIDFSEPEPLRVAVLYSSYRQYAMVWVNDGVSDRGRIHENIPAGWSTLWSDENDTFESLFDLHFDDDVVVAIGAAHLTCLIAGRDN